MYKRMAHVVNDIKNIILDLHGTILKDILWQCEISDMNIVTDY